MKRRPHQHQPPRALRHATLDNIAIVPASLLPYRARYQALANRLPEGAVLIVLPDHHASEQQTLTVTARLFQAKGHNVTVMTKYQLVEKPSTLTVAVACPAAAGRTSRSP